MVWNLSLIAFLVNNSVYIKKTLQGSLIAQTKLDSKFKTKVYRSKWTNINLMNHNLQLNKVKIYLWNHSESFKVVFRKIINN